MSAINDFFLQMFLPGLANIGALELTKVFDAYAIKHPEAHKTLMVSLYPIIDVRLENLTTESKTKFDNPFSTALKLAIETSAAANGIELPNLDAGQIGD
jgi:hypothetical protein